MMFKKASLWIVPLLNTYFQQPQLLRKKQLLLDGLKPRKDFVKSTVATWIKKALK